MVSNIKGNGNSWKDRHVQVKKRNCPGRGEEEKKDRTEMKKSMKAKWKSDHIMIDRRTTSHMTPRFDCVNSRTGCDVSINIDDNYNVISSSIGTRTEYWMCQTGRRRVNVSETLVYKELFTSLISVPVLTKKNIGEISLPEKASIIEIEDE